MMFRAKGIGHGLAEGEVVVSHLPISFLGGVDPGKGTVVEASSDIKDAPFAGKILAFPHGKGSTVGSYVIFQLKKSGTAPAAMINYNAEAIVATGAILAGIPMLTGIPMDILGAGDRAVVNADEGTVDLPDVEEKPVVTVIAKKGGKILLLKRSEKVGTYQGLWAGVSGGINPGEVSQDAAVRELKEETGLDIDASMIAAHAGPIYARDGRTLWKIHAFLAEVESERVDLDWEHDEYRWMAHDGLKGYQTVPKLDRVIEHLLKAESVKEKRVC